MKKFIQNIIEAVTRFYHEQRVRLYRHLAAEFHQEVAAEFQRHKDEATKRHTDTRELITSVVNDTDCDVDEIKAVLDEIKSALRHLDAVKRDTAGLKNFPKHNLLN
jgi:aminopeptidase N